MKKIGLVLIGLILITGFGFAIDTEFSLACLGAGYDEKLKTAVFENQVVPINEAFGLNADLTDLENTAKGASSYGTWQPNIFATKISTSIPARGMKYEVIRDGEILSLQSTTVQERDIVRLTPELDIGNDWIAEGASADSPPIIILEPNEYNELKKKLLDEFDEKYPRSSWYGRRNWHADYTYTYTGIGHGTDVEIPVFSTETTEFNETGSYYLADNGHPAYIVPAFNGKKAGVQIFATSSLLSSLQVCRRNGSAIECPARTGTLPIESHSETLVHIDKIIDGETAIDAGWATEYGRDAVSITYPPMGTSYYLKLQVVPPEKQAPVADFECTFGENPECDPNKSYDPDGEIIGFQWKTNTAEFYRNQPKQISTGILQFDESDYHGYSSRYALFSMTVSLTVIDNDGFTNEKSKTLNFVKGEIEEPNSFILEAGYENGMAQITAECDGIVELDIENAMNGKSEIEKVQIPCNETTEIGPFTTKGAYRTIGTNKGQTKEAIFTVN